MPKKLLVADKSVVIQKSVGITFAQEDYSVMYVSDGEDALNRARQLKPDLVLIHIQTPKISGYDVCDAIKKDPQIKNTPVLLLVGIHEQLDEAKAKSCGSDGSIIKPFESQVLIDKVNEMISRRPSAPEVQPSAPPPSRPAAAAPPMTPQNPPAMPFQTTRPPEFSPSSTISGQVPIQPPRSTPVTYSTPSPTSTIAGQAPPARAAMPLLDLSEPLEVPVKAPEPPQDSTFEFSIEDSFTPEGTTQAAQAAAPTAPATPAAAVHETATSEETDIWGFGDTTVTPEVSASPPPPEPTIDFGAADGGIDLSEPTIPPPTTDWAQDSGTGDISFAEVESLPPIEPIAPLAQEPGYSFGAAEEPSADFAETPVVESAFDFSGTPTGRTDFQALEPEEGAALPAIDLAEGNDQEPVASSAPALTDAQIEAIVTKVFRQVIERIAWEVVPDMAETIIKEELKRLTQEHP